MQLLQYNLIKLEIKTKLKSQNYNNLGNPAYAASTHSDVHVDDMYNRPKIESCGGKKPNQGWTESSELWMN